jgi:regulator of sigma E protease
MPDFPLQVLDVLRGNVLPALVVLTAVVFVHEMGHFLVARWCGIRVAAFSIGFGRELVGFTDRRGTRWKLSLIPLGGYVRFEGDENAASVPDAEALARIPPAERRGLFYFAPLWKRFVVVAAGPAANFILAVLVFAAVFTLIGRPHIPAVAGSVEAGTPADLAGFEAGDRIVSIDGRSVSSFADLQDIVMTSAGRTLTVAVERKGEELTLSATPRTTEREDITGRTHQIPVLGIRSGPADFRTDDPLTALGEGAKQTARIVDQTLTYLGQLVTGRQSPSQMSGIIGIGQISGAAVAEGGLAGLVYLTAFLSVSIGLFNLFPIPILDGGHLLFYAIEAVRGRPLSPRLQDIGFRIGFALVIMLFIFVTWNDIARTPGAGS